MTNELENNNIDQWLMAGEWHTTVNSIKRATKFGLQGIVWKPCTKGGAVFLEMFSGPRRVGISLSADAVEEVLAGIDEIVGGDTGDEV